MHVAAVRLRSSACPTRRPSIPAPIREDDLDIVELDRTGRADVERLEQPMHRIENRPEIRSGSISPSLFFRGAVQSDPADECRSKDAGIADAGAAKLDAAREQRQRADAELDGLGLEDGRPVIPWS